MYRKPENNTQRFNRLAHEQRMSDIDRENRRKERKLRRSLRREMLARLFGHFFGGIFGTGWTGVVVAFAIAAVTAAILWRIL